MPKAKRRSQFYLTLRSGETFGPFHRSQIEFWVCKRILFPHAPVFEEGDSDWKTLNDIEGLFINGHPNAYLGDDRDAEKLPHWWHDDVTAKQIEKLDFFGIPCGRSNLTKGHASALIDFMIAVDPQRERQHQNQPATEEQLRNLHEYGYRKSGLTLRAASEVALELRHLSEIEFLQREPIGLGLINVIVNDPEFQALYGYSKIPKKELRVFLRYLRENVPNWRSLDAREIAAFVPFTLLHKPTDTSI